MSFKNSIDVKKTVQKNPSLSNIYRTIQKKLDQVENSMQDFSGSSNPLISEINSYIFKKKGKRIRPALVLLSSRLFDYKGHEDILMCSLVEALHTASLIHDDIIDNSNLRRGGKTVHAKWGPNITVLLGDYLYIKTIGRSLLSSNPQIIRILSDTSAEMIDGELFEYYMTGNLDIEEDQYLEIINKKTAALFSTSCLLGGVLGDASEKEKTDLIAFGTYLGMSFQIIDDILDYKGDEKTIGKPVLSDMAEGRITLPLIYTLYNGSLLDRSNIKKFIANPDKEKGFKQKILSVIQSNGALEYSYQKAEDYSLKAKNIIQNFAESDHRKALSLISDYILVRNK